MKPLIDEQFFIPFIDSSPTEIDFDELESIENAYDKEQKFTVDFLNELEALDNLNEMVFAGKYV